MALCRIVFLHKSSDALDLLTEAKLERRCRLVEKGLPRLYAGYYVVELLNELTHHGDPHPELFDAADRVLLALENGGDVAATVMHFELAALRLLGHSPALLECVGCGESILLDGRIAFGLLAGGVLCDRCRVGRRQVVRISSLALQTMRQLTQTDEVNAAYSVVDPQIRGELRGVLNQYMNNLIGHRPRLQKQLAMLA